MIARKETDLFSGIVFLFVSLVILNAIIPDFSSNMTHFIASQFPFIVFLFSMAFCVAIIQRKMFEERK